MVENAAKIAVAFSGQGAQFPKMGEDLFTEPIVEETFAEAEDLLGYSLREIICSDEEKLNQTQYTQPAIYVLTTAIWRLFQAHFPLRPLAGLGLSLGEYTALTASGALSFAEGVPLIARRGELMQEAVPPGQGKMAAVMNADAELIAEVCRETAGVVVPANFNTPQQIVIGGEAEAVERASEALKARGVKRVIPLNVSGPFHTPLMADAAKKLDAALHKVDFKTPDFPVITNVTAQVVPTEKIRATLFRQIQNPVRFSDSLIEIARRKPDLLIEIGPGKVIANFARKTIPEIERTNISDQASLKKTLAILNEVDHG